MGKGSDAASYLFTSSLDGKKPYSSCKEMPQEVRSLGKHKANHYWKRKYKRNCLGLKKAIHSKIQKDFSDSNSEECIIPPKDEC